jgi:intracellular sulfur oxidation DsrE/DsrF family protein
MYFLFGEKESTKENYAAERLRLRTLHAAFQACDNSLRSNKISGQMAPLFVQSAPSHSCFNSFFGGFDVLGE